MSTFKVTRKCVIYSSLVNLFLSGLKILVGTLGHSQALVADGLHSLSDLAVDGGVLVAAYFAQQAPDEEHPYGHGRIETLAVGFMALVLFGVAIFILIKAAHTLRHPNDHALNPLAIAVIPVCVLGSEWLYRIIRRYAVREQSHLLHAHAWHYRLDALSSAIAGAGLCGAAWLNIPILDPISAIAISFFIFKNSWEMGLRSCSELIDTSADTSMHERILKTIQDTPGVWEAHQLRTRFNAGFILVDVHVRVHPWISVSEGHYIGELVLTRLSAIPEIKDVMIHIDPEDDHEQPNEHPLPDRRKIEQALQPLLKRHHVEKNLIDFRLHYLESKLNIELIFQFGNDLIFLNNASSKKEFIECIQKETGVSEVFIYLKI